MNSSFINFYPRLHKFWRDIRHQLQVNHLFFFPAILEESETINCHHFGQSKPLTTER